VLANSLALLGLVTLVGLLTLVIDVNAYLFIAVAVIYLFFRYLLIVILVIYSLLKMVAEKGSVPEAEVVQNQQFISTDVVYQI